MSDAETIHIHLDDDQVDELARAILDGSAAPPRPAGCNKCQEEIDRHARYLSISRLATRDAKAPIGTPAVDAVRTIRRRSYRNRALRELAALTLAPVKAVT